MLHTFSVCTLPRSCLYNSLRYLLGVILKTFDRLLSMGLYGTYCSISAVSMTCWSNSWSWSKADKEENHCCTSEQLTTKNNFGLTNIFVCLSVYNLPIAIKSSESPGVAAISCSIISGLPSIFSTLNKTMESYVNDNQNIWKLLFITKTFHTYCSSIWWTFNCSL